MSCNGVLVRAPTVSRIINVATHVALRLLQFHVWKLLSPGAFCASRAGRGPLSATIHKMSTFPVRRSEKVGMDDPLAIVITIWNTMATWRRAPDKEAGDTLVLMFGIRRLKKWLAHQVHSDGVSSRLLLPSASQRNLINATSWVVRPVTFGITATCALIRPDDRIPSGTFGGRTQEADIAATSNWQLRESLRV